VRFWGSLGASTAAGLGVLVFVGQIVGKWAEGGWVVLISFSVLILAAHAILISPIGLREPVQIHRIVREKARVQGAMASIVEWQSLKMQEYRYAVLAGVARFFEWFGVRRPLRYEPVPVAAGDYDHALHVDHPEAPSILAPYLNPPPAATQPAAPAAGDTPSPAEPTAPTVDQVEAAAPPEVVPSAETRADGQPPVTAEGETERAGQAESGDPPDAAGHNADPEQS
jgi:hypothetical protein